MRLFHVIMALLCSVVVCAQDDAALKKQFEELDHAIDHADEYVAVRRRNIAKLYELYQQSTSPSARYELSYKLYESYKPYRSDSAYLYINKCLELAETLGNYDYEVLCRSRKAHLCSTIGLFVEALNALEGIDESRVSPATLSVYYTARHHIYTNIAYHSMAADSQNQYYKLAGEYEGKILSSPDHSSFDYIERLEMNQLLSKKLDASLKTSDEWMKRVKKRSHPYAVMAFYRYLEYKERNDSLKMLYWVTESAITDVTNGVFDQGAMWELANQLLYRGDMDRAYRYISYAADCASKFGTRLRSWQIMPLETVIEQNYLKEKEHSHKQLLLMLGLISALALFMIGLAVYVALQRKRLALLTRQLLDKNKEMENVNTQLSDSNFQLRQLNGDLKELNAQLTEANKVKEEYVGRFIRLCSVYIDKIDGMRKRVNKMVKNHEYDELYQMTRSQSFTEKELDELYGNFDMAFLHLFPNFVDDFNSLLKPEERIIPEDSDRLNTSLRIFALIRLGIEDSSKIAEFLHYSVNTIYNYRARIKNNALDDRTNFEQNVKRIGMI